MEKRAEKLALQTKENNELFKFFNEKLKNAFSTKKVKEERGRPELDEAIREYENGEYYTYNSIEEMMKDLKKKYQIKLANRVKKRLEKLSTKEQDIFGYVVNKLANDETLETKSKTTL